MAGTGANPTTSTGGRFPSDLNVNRTRNLGVPQSPSSESSDRDTINAAPAVVPIIRMDEPARKYSRDNEDPYRLKGIASHSPGMTPGPATTYDDDQARYMAPTQAAVAQPQHQADQSFFLPGQQHLNEQPASAYQQQQPAQPAQPTFSSPSDNDHAQSSRGDWMAPAAVGAGVGAAGAAAYNHNENHNEPELQQQAAKEAALVDDGTDKPNDLDLQLQAAKEAAYIDDSGREANPIVAPAHGIPSTAQDAPMTSTRDVPIALAPSSTSTSVPGTVDNAPISSLPSDHGANGTYLSYPSNTGSGLDGSSKVPVAAMDDGLGGLESKGAHETGQVFPAVVRHNTDISVSQLHVPGEFPKKV